MFQKRKVQLGRPHTIYFLLIKSNKLDDKTHKKKNLIEPWPGRTNFRHDFEDVFSSRIAGDVQKLCLHVNFNLSCINIQIPIE